jgi:tRNA-dihydrouridine synthase
VKSWVSIPVVGNGGIFSTDDARRCLMMTGCDGIMVGRGAVVRPWVPAAIARELYEVDAPGPAAPRPALYQRFVDLLEESFPAERRLGRLKEFTHYFSRTYPFGHELAVAVQRSHSVEEACAGAGEFFARNESGGESGGEELGSGQPPNGSRGRQTRPGHSPQVRPVA